MTGSPASAVDRGRSAVYAAEDQVGAVLARGGRFDFHGSQLDLPQQRRFGDLSSVQRYLAEVRTCSWGAGDVPSPRVTSRRGPTRASWSAPDVIRLPAQAWAMTELVVLHEYGHHVTWHREGRTAHDRAFCGIMHDLVSGALGEAAGLLLWASYDAAGALRGGR